MNIRDEIKLFKDEEKLIKKEVIEILYKNKSLDLMAM